MAQASRVLNQCNQLNLLTKKDIQLIMLVEEHPSKLVLHSLAGALTKKKVAPIFKFLPDVFYIVRCFAKFAKPIIKL